MQHRDMLQGLRTVCQALQRKAEGRHIREHAAGRLPEKNGACSLCRRCGADIQGILDHVGFSGIQLNLSGSVPVPADILSRAASLSPGQAAVRCPQRFFPMACQLKGAFFTGRRPAWSRTREGTGTRRGAGRTGGGGRRTRRRTRLRRWLVGGDGGSGQNAST